MERLSAKGLERNSLLQSSEMIRGTIQFDAETAEAVEVLTGMKEVATPVSPTRLCTLDYTNNKEATHAIKRAQAQDTIMGLKRKRQVLTQQLQRDDERAPEACIPCPVCSRGLDLPLDIDLMEPVMSISLSVYMKDHADRWHPHEPLWNALSTLESECLDTESIVRMKSNAASVVALVAQSLAIAARSLRIPKHKNWAECWSRVKALTLARIGSAHCSATNVNLFAFRGSIAGNTEGEIRREAWIKREACRYLAALMSSVEATPPCLLWQSDSSCLPRIDLIEKFFSDGANHRHLGFIHPDFLPRSCPFSNVIS
jgi:hypothetical protein